jgi:hypothetical protein
MGGMLDVALENAALGFRVFPLRPGTKKPAHTGWQDEATMDESLIRRLWNGTEYNVGIMTGRDLIVLDIDVKNGREGMETFKRLGLSAEGAYVVRTPSGGFHVYFRGPDVANSVQKLGPGLDVRGSGGYVVAAGSTIPEGGYQALARGQPPPASAELLRLLGPSPEPRGAEASRPAAGVTLDHPAAVDRALAYLAGPAPLAVENRGGDHVTYTVAARLKDFGISDMMAWELMSEHWNPRCSPPWDSEDLWVKVSNAYEYGVNQPGAASPQHDFNQVTIPPQMVSRDGWTYTGERIDLNQPWLFHGMLGQHGVALVVGESGSGKTFLMGEIARCVATGKPFFGIPPDEKGGTLFMFAGSEGSGFGLRMAALGEGALPIAWRSVFNLRDRSTMEQLAVRLQTESLHMEEAFGVPLRMVVFETFSASGLVEKENDNAQIAEALGTLSRLSDALKVLVVVTHHPPKSGGDDPRGGGAFRGSVDYILAVQRDGRSPVRTVELTKGRNVQERQIGSFTLIDVVLGQDARGRTVSTMALSMGAVQTKIERQKGQFERLLESWELVGEKDMVDLDGERWGEEDAWRKAWVQIDTAKTKAERERRFKVTMRAALNANVVEQHMGPDGMCARPRQPKETT